jgi:N-methylhydantoinase A
MGYIVGIDIGGTFTDCTVIDEAGEVTVAKSPSTPPDFARGFFDVLGIAAERLDLSLDGLLAETTAIGHGTTVATNAMVERRGAKVGLITTAGHGDVLRMMRAYGRVAGLPPADLMHYSIGAKPDPIVPRDLIEEVDERIDSKGEIVVALDEAGATAAIDRLLEQGVEAIAVSLLWSFKNPVHERRLLELIEARDGAVFTSTSSALAPLLGEYERTAAVAVNSYVGPITRDYLDALTARATDSGYSRPINLMECSGGVAPAPRAAKGPIRLIGSGPAGGVIGTRFLADRMGIGDVVATDMGGTTFDVGLVIDGEPIRTSTTIVDKYEYYVPTIDISSIGAGGGSIASFDANSSTIRVGPESAGAAPGPVCFGRGGERPTVTDADLILGYLNPEYFLRGAMALDKDAAEAALAKLGEPLGRSAIETAAGVVQIIDFHMADQIRKLTVERGYDPRELAVFSYGGAGPVHGGAYGRELGAKQLIVPLASTASVWSALGIGSSDLLYVYELARIMPAPWDPGTVAEGFAELEERAVADLGEAGFAAEEIVFQRVADVRYSLQVHVVEVPIPTGELDHGEMERLTGEFESRYEGLYGAGSGFAGAGIEIVNLRLRAVGRTIDPAIQETAADPSPPPDGARRPSRQVYWHEHEDLSETDIWDGTQLTTGAAMEGPCVIEMPETTIVVRPGQSARIDAFGNVIVDL